MFDPKVGKTLALISQMGINMIVPIFMMGWLGSWLADKFSMQILFPLCLLLGIAGGFRSVYSLVEPMIKDGKKEKKDHETEE